jgi:hypothetical protein
MCNQIHPESKLIPVEGEAWKLFMPHRNGSELRSFVMLSPYEKGADGWIHWDDLLACLPNPDWPNQMGFCAFPNEAEATRCMNLWPAVRTYLSPIQLMPPLVAGNPRVVRKIKYREGLGGHSENSIIGGSSFDIVLFKSFVILEE